MEQEQENNDIIKKALMGLNGSINNSLLPDNEKQGLMALVNRLSTYYEKKLDLMAKRGIDINSNDLAISEFKRFIMDIIVEINEVLTGNNDIYYFISIMNNRLNNKEINKLVGNAKKKVR